MTWLADLGTRDYKEVWDLQKELVQRRLSGEIQDVLILVEHPEVITLGKRGKPDDVFTSEIPVYTVERGGEATYHGPGQLVCYPIFNLRHLGLTVRQYLHRLEEVIIGLLNRFDIQACRSPHMPGVWVNDAEISSIGIHVSHGMTMHGFTLNVSTNLRCFSYINVCGVPGKKITSIACISGKKPVVEDFVTPIIRSFEQVFDLDIQPGESALISGCDDE